MTPPKPRPGSVRRFRLRSGCAMLPHFRRFSRSVRPMGSAPPRSPHDVIQIQARTAAVLCLQRPVGVRAFRSVPAVHRQHNGFLVSTFASTDRRAFLFLIAERHCFFALPERESGCHHSMPVSGIQRVRHILGNAASVLFRVTVNRVALNGVRSGC